MPAHFSSPWSRSLALLVALVLVALSARLASAHTTTVTSSDPVDGAVVAQAPAQVMAQFSEELDTKGSTMVVKDAGGQQVSDGSGKVDLNDANRQTLLAALPNTLADGVYTVVWHALLTDGDASDGSFKFTVQNVAHPVVLQVASATVGATETSQTAVATQEPAAATAQPSDTPQPALTAPATQAAGAAGSGQPTVAETAVGPGSLPTTGSSGSLPIALIAGAAVVLAGFGTSLVLRRGAR